MLKSKQNKDSLANNYNWDNSYRNIILQVAPSDDEVRLLIEKYIPEGIGTCFEIGCFPARYLTVLGDLGYQLNGIDTYSKVNKLLFWLKQEKYKIGKIQQADFNTFTTKEKFNVVCSFGFIEHFVNWEELLIKHALFTKKNGYLIITTPNFRGLVQQILHRFFDSDNYNKHYIPSMNPYAWSRTVKKMGFKIIFCGYFGKFNFWYDQKKRNSVEKQLLKKINLLTPILKTYLPFDSSLYSPYCGLICIKE